MNCRIIVLDDFKKDAKKLLKKYISLKNELTQLQTALLENPRQGTLIYDNTYKIRLAVKSKGKGKSGGMRVITHVVEIEMSVDEQENHYTIFLLSIYDKSEMENISNRDIQYLIGQINTELDNEE